MSLKTNLFRVNSNNLLFKRAFNTFVQWDKSCWKCNRVLPDKTIQCTTNDCNSFQFIPDQVNYFQLFERPKQYLMDESSLKKQFLQLQRKVHPDNFTQVQEKDQIVSASLSSLLNKAYQTLKDPLSRAKYLLKIEGLPINETDSLEDNSLLFEIMELHEEIQDSDNSDQIDNILKSTIDQIQSTILDIEKSFQDKDYSSAKNHTIKLKYLVNVRKMAEDKFHTI